jgi:hypothetical protein
MKKDYAYSGYSSPEAIEDFRTHFISKLPRALRWLVKRGIIKTRLVMCCDGCGTRLAMDANSTLIPTYWEHIKRWSGTDWTHQFRLDFCKTCSENGTAERAIADGAKPLGTYTVK